MENDSIRASGSDTLVDIWINGKLRAISVARDAIDTFLGTGMEMSDDDRCEFVRTRLALVISAAKNRLAESNPSADAVIIDGTQLRRLESGSEGERRKGERRKTERRKTNLPKEALPHGERRRGDRRKGERRRPPNRTDN